MDLRPGSSNFVAAPGKQAAPWFQRLSRPILFLIISVALVGPRRMRVIPSTGKRFTKLSGSGFGATSRSNSGYSSSSATAKPPAE